MGLTGFDCRSCINANRLMKYANDVCKTINANTSKVVTAVLGASTNIDALLASFAPAVNSAVELALV